MKTPTGKTITLNFKIVALIKNVILANGDNVLMRDRTQNLESFVSCQAKTLVTNELFLGVDFLDMLKLLQHIILQVNIALPSQIHLKT